MKLSVTLEREYIPEWNGNREDAEPIVIEHYAPSIARRQDLIKIPELKILNVGEDDEQSTEMIVKPNNDELVLKMVTKIKNFEIDIDNGGKKTTKKIEKAIDLFSESAPTEVADLIAELGKYFQDILNKKVDEKN